MSKKRTRKNQDKRRERDEEIGRDLAVLNLIVNYRLSIDN